MGYPNSTGMAGAVAYRVTDERRDPTDTKRRSPRKRASAGVLLCYTPHRAPPVAGRPCLHGRIRHLGCFNALAVTPAVRALWGRLLRAVPHSRLVVEPFACASVQRRFLSAMAEQGVASWRGRARRSAPPSTSARAAPSASRGHVPVRGHHHHVRGAVAGRPGGHHARGRARAQRRRLASRSRRPRARVRRRPPGAYVAKCAALAADRAALAAAREGMRAKMRAPGGLCDGEAHAGWRRRTSRCGGGTAGRARVQ